MREVYGVTVHSVASSLCQFSVFLVFKSTAPQTRRGNQALSRGHLSLNTLHNTRCASSLLETVSYYQTLLCSAAVKGKGHMEAL